MKTKTIGYIFISIATVFAVLLNFLSPLGTYIFPSGPDNICKILGDNRKDIWIRDNPERAKYDPKYAPTCFDELSQEKMLFLVIITFTLFILILGIIILIQKFHWHRWYLSSFFIVTSIILLSQAVYFSNLRRDVSDNEAIGTAVNGFIAVFIQIFAIPTFLTGIVILLRKSWRWYVAVLVMPFVLLFLGPLLFHPRSILIIYLIAILLAMVIIFKKGWWWYLGILSIPFALAVLVGSGVEIGMLLTAIILFKLFLNWKKSRKAQEVNTLNPPPTNL